MWEIFFTSIAEILKQLLFSKEFPWILSIFLSIFILKWQYPKLKGAFGEWKVKRQLSKLGGDYTSFHDIYIPKSNGSYTQVDHIVTSPYGIFVIETKHYQGWIFGEELKVNWTQVIYNKKSKMYNPIRQNYGHVQALKSFLNVSDDELYKSIVAFSTQATFKFKQPFKTAKVIHFPQLLKTIQSFHNQKITLETLVTINGQLNNLSNINKEQYKDIKRSHIKSIHQTKRKRIKAPVRKEKSTDVINTPRTCPKCGSSLQLKHGKYGSFFGCTNYPKCRFTESISA